MWQSIISIYLDINWFWSTIDLYPINIIFYSIKLLKIYNTNCLNNQHGFKVLVSSPLDKAAQLVFWDSRVTLVSEFFVFLVDSLNRLIKILYLFFFLEFEREFSCNLKKIHKDKKYIFFLDKISNFLSLVNFPPKIEQFFFTISDSKSIKSWPNS